MTAPQAQRIIVLEAERAELQRLLECAQKRIGELHDALKAKVLELPVEQMRQAEAERAELQRRLEEAKREAQLWRAVATRNDGEIRSMVADARTSIEFKAAGMTVVAAMCRDLIDSVPEAKNYCEIGFKDDKGALTLVIQRPEGETPAFRLAQAERERDAAREELREVGEAILRDGTALTIYPQTNGRVALNDVTHGTRTMPWDGTPAGIIAALLAARKAGEK